MSVEEELTCLEKMTTDYLKNHSAFLDDIVKARQEYYVFVDNVPLLVLFSFILCVGMLTNGFIWVLIPLKKNLTSPMNLLLMNMSLGHLVSCVTLFIFCFVKDTGVVGDSLAVHNLICGVLTDGVGFYFISAGAYLLTLCAISFNRYAAIRYPVRQHLRMSKRTVIAYNCVVWVLAAAWVIPSMISFRYDPITKLCMRDWKGINDFVYRLVALLWSMVLPLIFLLLSFSVIMWKRKEDLILSENINRKLRLQKAEKLLGLLILTFLFTWTPFFVYWTLYTVTDIFYGCLGEYRAMKWMRVAIVFSSINTVIDPYLYTVGSRDIRRCILAIFKKLMCRHSPNRIGISPASFRSTGGSGGSGGTSCLLYTSPSPRDS